MTAGARGPNVRRNAAGGGGHGDGLDPRFEPQIRAPGPGARHRAHDHRDRPAAVCTHRRVPGVRAAIGGKSRPRRSACQRRRLSS